MVFSVALVTLVACGGEGGGGGGLESGQSGLPEHTAGWAAAEAQPVAVEWQPDAALFYIGGGDYYRGLGVDGTTGTWIAEYLSTTAESILEVVVIDAADGGSELDSETYDAAKRWLIPMSGWQVNSDELANLLGSAPEFGGFAGADTGSDDVANSVVFTSAGRIVDQAMIDALAGLPTDRPIANCGGANQVLIDAVTGDLLYATE